MLVDILVLPVHVLWLAFAGRWVFQLELSTGFLVVLLVCFGASLAVISGTAVWLTGGQTLGKAMVGLTERRVGQDLQQDLRALGWSLGRHSAGYLVIDVFGAGGLVALGTPRRQTLHDLAFGSEVVHAPGVAVSGQSWPERGKAFADRLEVGLEASHQRYGWISFLWRWQAKLILIVAGIIWGLANLLGKAGVAVASAPSGTPPASSVPAAVPVSTKIATAIVVPTTLATGATVVAIGNDSVSQPEFVEAVGDWAATDLDGSNLRMTLERIDGSLFRFSYHDDGATVCGLDSNGEPRHSLSAEGVGEAKGDAFMATGIMATCAVTGENFLVDWTYVYDPAEDTIRELVRSNSWPGTANTDTVWSRR